VATYRRGFFISEHLCPCFAWRKRKSGGIKNTKTSVFILSCSRFALIVDKLGGTSEIKIKNFVLILFCSRFALIVDKLGGTSEIKIKNFVFDFVFLSVCTNFAS